MCMSNAHSWSFIKGQALAHEIIDFLGKRQFLLRGVYNMTYDHEGQAVQGDFLFRRSQIGMDPGKA